MRDIKNYHDISSPPPPSLFGFCLGEQYLSSLYASIFTPYPLHPNLNRKYS